MSGGGTKTGEVSFVRLQAENMDLRQMLEKASTRIEELQQMVTSNTVHHTVVPKGMITKEEHDSLKIEYKGYVEKLNSYIKNQHNEVEKAKKENEALKKKNSELEETNDMLKNHQAVAEDNADKKTTPEKELNAAKKEVQLKKEEIERLKREVEQLKKREMIQQQVISELETAMEMQREQSLLMETEQDANKEGQPCVDTVKTISKVNRGRQQSDSSAALSDEEWNKKLQEMRQEIEQQAEEEVFKVSLEMQEKIEAQEEEIAKLKCEVEEIEKIKSERDKAVSSMEKAHAERAIALRVKDGALQECTSVKNQLDKQKSQVDQLNQNLKELKAAMKSGAGDADKSSTSPGGYRDPLAEHFNTALTDSSNTSVEMKAKNEVIENLQNRIAELEAEEEMRREKHGADLVAQLTEKERQIQYIKEENEKMMLELENAKSDAEIMRKERDKAMAAGKRAFLERNEALSGAALERQKREQVERMQKKVLNEDRETVKQVMDEVDNNYNVLAGKVDHAETPEERKEILYDCLFDYERKIWHLNNDIASAKTVRQLRENDIENAVSERWSRRCEEYMSAIEILRMQIRDETGKEPVA